MMRRRKRKEFSLGDFYRGNLNQLRQAAQEMVKDRNLGKKSDEKESNLLGDKKPWKLVLESLDAENREYEDWGAECKARVKKGETGIPAAPAMKLTRFINDAAARLQRIPSLEQVRFEMEEYQARNEIAHNELDAALLEAKNAFDAESPLWHTFGQLILRERQAIKEGNLPARLIGKEKEIMETLLTYQQTHFRTLTNKKDPLDGSWIPDKVIVADQHLPELLDPPVVNDNLKNRVLQFGPQNSYEQNAVNDYFEAVEEMRKAIEDVEKTERAHSIAQAEKNSASKARRLATHHLKSAIATFRAAEAFRLKEALEEEEEAGEAMRNMQL